MELAHAEIKNFKDKIVSLQTKNENLENNVLDRFDNIAQYQRRNNLWVFDISEDRSGETYDKILNLFKDKLNTDISTYVVDRSDRIGRKMNPDHDSKVQPRAIIVKFVIYKDRKKT